MSLSRCAIQLLGNIRMIFTSVRDIFLGANPLKKEKVLARSLFCQIDKVKVTLSLRTSQVAYQPRTYPGICGMKRLKESLGPPPPPWDGMLVNCGVIPSNKIHRHPFIHLGGERHCENRVSYPRTQYNVPGQGSNPDRSIKKTGALAMRQSRLPNRKQNWYIKQSDLCVLHAVNEKPMLFFSRRFFSCWPFSSYQFRPLHFLIHALEKKSIQRKLCSV